jgi:aspartyl-tRNA(Asn)/glutamyl-tRNA(Gln) amidotransferase subunit B
VRAARAALPELPSAKAERLEAQHGLSAERAHELAFNGPLGAYYEAALNAEGDGVDAVALANWLPSLVERIGPNADPAASNVTPAALAELTHLVSTKAISRDAGRTVLDRLVASGGEPKAIVEAEGLGSLSADDGGLADVVAAAIAADPAAAEKVKDGTPKAMGPLVGYVMRETKGRADGGEVARLIRAQLGL